MCQEACVGYFVRPDSTNVTAGTATSAMPRKEVPCGTGYTTTSTGAFGPDTDSSPVDVCVFSVGYGRLAVAEIPADPSNNVAYTPASNNCEECVAGKYSGATCDASCTNCAAGKYSTSTTSGATDASVCTACDSDKYSAAEGAFASVTRFDCGKGKSSDNTNNTNNTTNRRCCNLHSRARRLLRIHRRLCICCWRRDDENAVYGGCVQCDWQWCLLRLWSGEVLDCRLQ